MDESKLYWIYHSPTQLLLQISPFVVVVNTFWRHISCIHDDDDGRELGNHEYGGTARNASTSNDEERVEDEKPSNQQPDMTWLWQQRISLLVLSTLGALALSSAALESFATSLRYRDTVNSALFCNSPTFSICRTLLVARADVPCKLACRCFWLNNKNRGSVENLVVRWFNKWIIKAGGNEDFDVTPSTVDEVDH